MTPETFNRICGSFPHATHVVQWGGADVWKVGGKLFAAMWSGPDPNAGVTFKPTPLGYDILRTQAGLRPAPYLASRGIKWIQRTSDETMSDEDLALYLRQSHGLVFQALSRKQRRALEEA